MGAIQKAYVFSAKVHKGQVRRSGEPYLSHPLAVAALLAEMHTDVASICAALLHDAVEDTETTVEDMAALLGTEVAALVDGVTKITQLSATTKTAQQAENMRKMILAMANDIRVLLDQAGRPPAQHAHPGLHAPGQTALHSSGDPRHLRPHGPPLGIRRWQAELEDWTLYFLEPNIYQRIKDGVATRQSERERFIAEVKQVLHDQMAEQGIRCEVSGRPKHFYSIYRKMQRRGVDIDQLYDLIAFRVVVDKLRDCYEALGVVHNVWKPIPGRFRDYIGMPKPNMYQSLHTSVVGPMGQRMEIQIRTEEMHRVAEEGIAAHWRYKEQGAGDEAEQGRFAWLRKLMEWQRDLEDPTEFMQSLKMNLYPGEIFVFTPGGEVKALPRGSTPIDFAYSIHTEVGHQCVGARVNGRMATLKSELKTGDQVEIITQSNHKPSKDWLNFVVSGRARSKIRSYIRESERSRSVSLGSEILDKELRKNKLTLASVLKDGKLAKVMTDLSFQDQEHLLAAVAYGKVSPRHIVNKILPRPTEEEQEKPGLIERSLKRLRRRPAPGGIKVQGPGRHPGAFRQVLQPPARRRGGGLHHPGPGGHHPPERLQPRARPGPRAAGGSGMGYGQGRGAAGAHPGDKLRPGGNPGRHGRGDEKARYQHHGGGGQDHRRPHRRGHLHDPGA